MDSMAVMFPSATGNPGKVHPDYAAEYAACMESSFFFPVLYNEYEFIRDGDELVVNMPAPVKSQYCILRGEAVGWKRYDDLCHVLKRSGYYPALRHIGGWATPANMPWHTPQTDYLYLGRVQPYHRYASHFTPGAYGWFPSLSVIHEVFPAVAKNGRETLCDDDGKPIVFRDIDYEGIDEVAKSFSDKPLDTSFNYAPMWFERYVTIAQHQGVPVEWRAFYYVGRMAYLCPKHRVCDVASYPKPPQSVLDDLRGYGFQSIDLALTTAGDWKVLKEGEGEYAKIPEGGLAAEFYERFEAELKQGPDIPEWSWCLVGSIVESHLIGEEKRRVYGSKHFAPKTKVYVVDAFWGHGAERCTALGIPRYTDHLIGVNMSTDLIENFRCEKVYDRDVLKAMWTNRLTEEFERDRRTPVSSYWGASERDREMIERFAESANKMRAKG